jgi:putative ABC transport system permease protein
MRVFRLLGLRRLRRQPLRVGLAVVSVAGGVSLAVAISVTTASLDASVRDFGRALAGPAELRVVGATDRGALPPEVLVAVEAVDGVRAVVPLVQTVTRVDRATVDGSSAGEPEEVVVLGVDCRATALLGDAPCDAAALGDRPVGVSASLLEAVGEGASLRTERGRLDLTGVPAIAVDGLGATPTVLLPLAAAQAQFGRPGGVDVAYVVPEPGADRGALRRHIAEVLRPQDAVLGRDDPPPVVVVGLAGFLPLFQLLGGFGVVTAVILVRNTVTLGLAERRRQLAIVGALGAAPRTVVGGVVGEAALLGGVGGLLGVAGGVLIAGPIVASLSAFTESVLGTRLERHVPAGVVLTGALLGAAAGAAAAWRPARRALRIDVAAELSGRGSVEDAAAPRVIRNLVLALALLAAGLGLCGLSRRDGGLDAWQAAVGPVGFLLLSIATLLCGGAAAPLVLRLAARLARSSRRAPLRLALAGLLREPRRAGMLALAISSPVVVAFATHGFVASARAGVATSFEEARDAASLSTVEPDQAPDGVVPDALLAAASGLPEVARVERGSFVLAGNSVDEMVGVFGYDGPVEELDPDLVEGSWDPGRFSAGEVLIGPGLARRSGARAGDTVTVETPIGVRDLPVLAVSRQGDFGGRNVVMTFAQLESLFGPPPVRYASLVPAPGSTEADVVAAAEAVLPAVEPSARIRTSSAIAEEIGDAIDGQMVPFRVMQQGLLLVAFVAVLSTLLLVGMQRRRETALLAAVGATPQDLRRTVLTEALLVAGAAVLQALVLGLLVLWGLLLVAPVILGFENPYRVSWIASLGAGVVALVVTALAALWPAWRASRVEVLDALRYE